MSDRLLLVEDRESLRGMLGRALAAEFDVDEIGDGSAALTRLATERYAVVVSDVRLPGVEGTTVLKEARRLDPAPEVVLMTAYAEVPAAVAALRAGAYDYLAKPFEPADLVRVARRAADRYRLVQRARSLEDALLAGQSALLGVSPTMEQVRRLVDRLGPLPVAVLVTGESGTGKEVVARELHRVGGRGPFVALNCGAIPENLLEAELFGVAKGAFTGAAADRRGLVEEAEGGVLFLDEIADLPLALQVKLNRLLEEGEYRRVGETRARRFSARVVAATHRSLDAMVEEGKFRSDLYYRLKVVEIRLPPLRDRPEDLPILAARFLHAAVARFGRPGLRLSPDALSVLERARWPGNVRELRHAIEHAAVMAEGEIVEPSDLPDSLGGSAHRGAPGSYRDAVEAAKDRAGRAYLLDLLARHDGNVTRACVEAGVERETLHRLLRRHDVDPARYRDGA